MPKPYQPPPIDWHQQPLLRARTVAKLLDVTPQHILNMIHDGRIDAVTLPTIRGYTRHRDKYRVTTASVLRVISQKVTTV